MSRKPEFPLPAYPVVRFYYKGMLNEIPRPAMITNEGNGNGVLDLVYWERNRRDAIPATAVMHKDDPNLTQTRRDASGCWDYYPGTKPETLVFTASEAAAATMSLDDAKEAVNKAMSARKPGK